MSNQSIGSNESAFANGIATLSNNRNDNDDVLADRCENEFVTVSVPFVQEELSCHQIPSQTTLLTIPSGPAVDAKNTLQSLDDINNNSSIAPATTTFVSDTVVALATQYPPILPNGEAINAKNINQSYAVLPDKNNASDRNMMSDTVVAWAAQYPPVLPNGEEINAKNINQSYVAPIM
jgi:hypothetical protein